MPGRHAIFVDAGFLLASVGEALHRNSERSRLGFDYAGMLDAVAQRTTSASGCELLRIYWYDGAVNKVPTAEQRRIGLLPDVKLRLGRIVAGHQKGVDSLVVLDLLRLAATGTVEAIYLISGDDDLSEGVREAQAHGVRVVLLGVAGDGTRLSEAMQLEADRVELWPLEFWKEWVSTAEPAVATDRDRAAERGRPADTAVSEALRTFERVGYNFSARWLDECSEEDEDRVRRSRPRIPPDIDARLLWDTSAGRDLSEGERVALRDGFWRAFDELDEDELDEDIDDADFDDVGDAGFAGGDD
ncbi:MAG: NYN domain-containing protein, partial [Acidimicrobiia bacterium]|nr:NYN domain-containing protein [Acidimicrobiia bacterium]